MENEDTPIDDENEPIGENRFLRRKHFLLSEIILE